MYVAQRLIRGTYVEGRPHSSRTYSPRPKKPTEEEEQRARLRRLRHKADLERARSKARKGTNDYFRRRYGIERGAESAQPSAYNTPPAHGGKA